MKFSKVELRILKLEEIMRAVQDIGMNEKNESVVLNAIADEIQTAVEELDFEEIRNLGES